MAAKVGPSGVGGAEEKSIITGVTDWLTRLTAGVCVDDVDGIFSVTKVGSGVGDPLRVVVDVVVGVMEKGEDAADGDLAREGVGVPVVVFDSLIVRLGELLALEDADGVLDGEDVADKVRGGIAEGVGVVNDVLEKSKVLVGVFVTLLAEGDREAERVLEVEGVVDGCLVCERDCDGVFVGV